MTYWFLSTRIYLVRHIHITYYYHRKARLDRFQVWTKIVADLKILAYNKIVFDYLRLLTPQLLPILNNIIVYDVIEVVPNNADAEQGNYELN